MSQNALLPRAEVAPEHTWDTAGVFADSAAFDAAVDAALARVPAIQAWQGRLGESPALLADALQAIEEFSVEAYRILMYASAEQSVDTTNQEAAARMGRARSLEGQAGAAVAFVEPELMGIGFDTLRRWTQEEPRLAHYGHYIDRLEQLAAHVRSAEVEELLGLAADPFGTAAATHSILTNSEMHFAPATDASGQTLEVAQGTISALVTHPEREVRRQAWESYADAHLAFKNTQATCLETEVKKNVFMARARRYSSALEAATGQTLIPTAVFHNLIETFRRHLPTWHRYWALRKRALGLATFREYDIKAPLTEAKGEIEYAQAVDWICEGLRPLGDEYVSIVRQGCTDLRWVDIYPNKGKGQGAYSTGVPGTHPFIFMNYNNDIFSLSTLAHELGHSLHSYYTNKTQPLAYADYGIFVAEVASNFNQALVRDYLFRTQPDRDFQIAVIEEAMSNFHRYFFLMPTLARFELAIHERVERNQPLTADGMNDLLADLFAEAYGDGVELDRARTGITWAQFSTHLYFNFYVYQYATGLSGAHALARRVLDGAPGAVDAYLGFLKAGASDYPLEVLKRAGVDLSTPEPVEQTFAVLAGLVDRLESLLT